MIFLRFCSPNNDHNGFDYEDINLVTWLVKSHLKMSTIAQKSDLDSDDTYTELIYQLEKPYTVTMIPPKVTMKFGTLQALSASDVGGLCNIWAEEPVFTVKIE